MEEQQGFPFKVQSMTLVTYDVDCANIADLNDTDRLKFLGFTSRELTGTWEDWASQKQDPPTGKLVDG